MNFDGSTPPPDVRLQRAREKEASEAGERGLEMETVDTVRVGAPNAPPVDFSAIEVKQIDANLYVADESVLWRPPNARGVYGGQLIGAATSCGAKTVLPEKHIHSLHAYFLMAGDSKRPIVYHVKNLRDGKSFSTRLVTASQGGQAIFVLLMSFQVPYPVGQRVIDHQIAMPLVPKPDDCLTMEQYYLALMDDPRCPDRFRSYLEGRSRPSNSPIDMRPAIASDFFYRFGPLPTNMPPKFPQVSRDVPEQVMWIRVKHRLPDDPATHAAVLAFASDMGLLGTAKNNVNIADISMIASLDHSMWFHGRFRADEWLLYSMKSPRATDGRGLSYGGVFTMSGELVVTVAQEGVLRVKDDRVKPKPKI